LTFIKGKSTHVYLSVPPAIRKLAYSRCEMC